MFQCSRLKHTAASGVGASGRLSAERVQTVLRHAREVLLSYERSYGTDDFLNNTFQAGDMKCFEFEVNRFSSGVLGVDTTSCAIDDDDEGPSEELKELVARKHWLRLQDWEHNDAVLTAKTAPITTTLCRLDPESSPAPPSTTRGRSPTFRGTHTYARGLPSFSSGRPPCRCSTSAPLCRPRISRPRP